MIEDKVLWFDLINTSNVFFFKPFIDRFKDDNEILITCRDLAGTADLLDNFNLEYEMVGYYGGENKISKGISYITRGYKLLCKIGEYDYAFSYDSISPSFMSYFRSGKTISYYDNEYSDQFRILARNSDYFIVPKVDYRIAQQMSSRRTNVLAHPGVKEQMYLSDFVPDKSEIDIVPFDDYLVVRPEAWKSHYLKGEILAYDITKSLVDRGYNIVLLPRYDVVPRWVKELDTIFIPEKALNGPQLCWFSDGVLTGSGTLAREAAVLGVPSISFYPGKPLMVDRYLKEKGLIFMSKDIDDITRYIENSERTEGLLEISKKVKRSLFKQIQKIDSGFEAR